MHLLVLNCGSATLKWKLFSSAGDGLNVVSAGSGPLREGECGEAIRTVLDRLPLEPDVIAHRVVHGGDLMEDVVLVDQAVLRRLREFTPLAPLHNGPALEGIEATLDLGIPVLAAFDSGFHRTIPDVAARYAIPAIQGVRRYGFHGWSHMYVTERYAELSGSPEPTIVTLHLGNGCSAAAIRNRRSVDTSMGYSPLEGLVMGTRAGDLDPGLVLHLLQQGLSVAEFERMLNHESGLKAIAGTNDMRELLRRTDADARFAVELFCYRARKYVGAYLAVLEGQAEAIVFTGGIGEHSAEIRKRIAEPFTWAGLMLDPVRNERGDERISSDGSRLAAYAIRTDEEGLIAREAYKAVRSKE